MDQESLALLSQIVGTPVSEDSLAFEVKMEGNLPSGHFDAQFAQSMVCMQQAFYSIVAKKLHDTNATIQSLTDQEKEAYRLHFYVTEGCTKATADLIEKVTELLKAIENMGKGKLAVIAGLLVLAFGGSSAVEGLLQVKKDEISSNEKVLLSKEETKRLYLLAEVFYKSGKEVSENFVKNSTGIKEITVGARKFDEKDIKLLQKRAPRAHFEDEIIEDKYYILGIDITKDNIISVVLKNEKDQKIIKAIYNIVDDQEDDTVYIRKMLCEAITTKSTLEVKLNARKKDGEISRAILLDIIDK